MTLPELAEMGLEEAKQWVFAANRDELIDMLTDNSIEGLEDEKINNLVEMLRDLYRDGTKGFSGMSTRALRAEVMSLVREITEE